MFADWVLIALLASALGGFGIIIDKLLITKYAKDWIYLTSFLGVLNFIPLLLFPLFFSPAAPVKTILFGIMVGVFFRIAILFYMKAISIEEASRVSPLFLMSPVFVLVLESIFLDEHLFLHHYVGFFAVIIGSFLIMTTRFRGIFRLRPAFYLMMLSNLVFSFGEVSMKYSSSFSDFIPLIFWSFAGSFIISLPVLLVKYRKKHTLFYRTDRLFFILPVEIVLFIAVIGTYLYAISLGPVSLVSTIGSSDGVFVFVYGIFFTMFAPSILKEVIDRKTLLTKALAMAIIIAGVFLINGGV